MRIRVASLFLAVLSTGLFAVTQETAPNASAPTISVPAASAFSVPRLVRFSGGAKDTDGKPLTGTIGITFLLYKDQQGGAPLWMETQNVQPDSNGRYSVQLGSTLPDGLPTDLFTSGEARWLAVQISGQAEQPRVLLLSVPYALKAADAETIGGLPPSAFVKAAPAQEAAPGDSVNARASSSGTANASSKSSPPTSFTVTTTGGTVNDIPLWTTSTNLQNSILSQGSMTVTSHGSYAADTDFRADILGKNNGASNYVSPGLRFGSGNSGEAVSSQRVNCTVSGCTNNVNGLDFDTDFTPRLSITNTGNVGIGTRTPANVLDVVGGGNDAVVATSTSSSQFAFNGLNSASGVAVYGQTLGSGGTGVWGVAPEDANTWAGLFNGNVDVTGSITAGTKDFKIDHPSDPAHKYLYHASIESSEMINLYTGNVTLDANGQGTVKLPGWFQAENADFRYTLTCIGGFAPVYVAQEISENSFKIAGGKPGMKVSWQVTGVRQDAYAKAHPLQVEVQKLAQEQGYYIHPELYGAPTQKSIEWARHPEMMKRMMERREKATPPANPPLAKAQAVAQR